MKRKTITGSLRLHPAKDKQNIMSEKLGKFPIYGSEKPLTFLA